MAQSGGVLEAWTCQCGQANLGPGSCSSCLNAAPANLRGAVEVVPPPRGGRTIVVLGVLTAVLLIAGLLSAAAVGTDDDASTIAGGRTSAKSSTSTSSESSSSPEDTTIGGDPAGEAAGDASPPAGDGRTVSVTPDQRPGPEASEIERLLPELMRFVQDKRGLAFKVPVEVTLLADKAFRARLKGEEEEDSEEAKEELLTTQRVLEGLGLLEKGIDLEKAVETLYGDAVAGFYDTESDDLVVRGEKLTVSVRTTLVHELVHAVQDQHFDIDRKDLDDRDDEASQGLTGLVEGDAVRVEELYLESLSNREQKQAEREEAQAGSGIDPDIPRILLQLVAFPYIVGPDFTRAVVEGGGQARLDEAFAQPPSTSEHLLHPETFLGAQPLVPIENPKPDGEEIDAGVLGELGLLLVLNASGTDGRAAAKGWGGDRYVAWRDGKNTCVRTTIAMDSLQDDAELRRALDEIARDRRGFKVEGKGPITFTSCG